MTINFPTRHHLTLFLSRAIHTVECQLLFGERLLFARCGRWCWRIAYRLTGRCGSRLNGHYPIFGNPHRWLWNAQKSGNHSVSVCSVCSARVSTAIGLPVGRDFQAMSRQADVDELHRMKRYAKSETASRAIDRSLRSIEAERYSKKTKEMRNQLIRAAREQRHDKIREIHEYLGEKKGTL